jgi:hypothetical protein
MLTHLIQRYGAITEEEIAANETLLHQPFDVSQSFESFVKRMQVCQNYANEANEPITDGRLTRIAVGLIKATHLFPTPTDKWDGKTVAEKTWEAFKTHFQKAYTKYIKSQETLNAAGIAKNAMIQADVANTQTDAANLVAISSHTQTQIATLAERISEMGVRLAAAQANNATPTIKPSQTKDQQIQEQAPIIEQLRARTKTNRANNNNNTDRRARTPANKDSPRTQRRFPGNRNYCWSCGFDIANKHTGSSCLFKQFGHIDTATLTNTEGGSQQQMHLVNT